MTSKDFRAWRLAMGWTQAVAAEHLNIHRRTVSNYERGTAPIPVVVKLATKELTRVAAE